MNAGYAFDASDAVSFAKQAYDNVTQRNVERFIRDNVATRSIVNTDQSVMYPSVLVNHAKKEYARHNPDGTGLQVIIVWETTCKPGGLIGGAESGTVQPSTSTHLRFESVSVHLIYVLRLSFDGSSVK